MLVLTRKPEQTIVMETADGVITVRVLKHLKAGVRIGVDAPPTVQITRGELREREENPSQSLDAE